ncbi:TPA: hypothetical protein MXD78_005342 [Klebsiella quasipneumoniae]|nr:hypothetical protein [Klebsiella quasipneumoniae]
MKNEVEQIALQNDMSIEFVTWFFNEKKAGCGNVWFMMMAAMWEGWKGRSIEMDKLATENMALKAAVAEEIEVINRGGQRYCVKDGMSINPIYARGWNDHRANLAAEKTPATDRIVAGIKADGVEEFAAKLRIPGDDQFFDALAKGVAIAADDFAKQLREGADK